MFSGAEAPLGDAEWLTLLSQEEPADAFERLRLHQLAGAGPERATTIDATARRALQVRAMLADRRQRLGELAALNQLAGRLTAIRDHSLLLAEVARQARRLLSVDVTYLMLVEPDGVLRIEVVDGSIGSALRGIELPIGTGIGGRILETGRPYAAVDYLHDQALLHEPDVDEAASSERLGGILGVPLRLGERTIGALFAAERRRRPFSDGEVSLLTALASHASLAINDARMLEDARRSARELDEANTALRSLADASRESSDLQDRLVQVVVAGRGLADVLGMLAAAMSAEVCLRSSSSDVVVGVDGNELENEDLSWIPAPKRPGNQPGIRARSGLGDGRTESGCRGGRHWLRVGIRAGDGDPGSSSGGGLGRSTTATACCSRGRRRSSRSPVPRSGPFVTPSVGPRASSWRPCCRDRSTTSSSTGVRSWSASTSRASVALWSSTPRQSPEVPSGWPS
jgi:hypothetical protein